MVAAGAGALMAASESGSSKGNDGVTSQYEAHNAQRSTDDRVKRSVKVEKKNSFRSPIAGKTTPIRETKASRLRAASIVSPTESTPVSRKSAIADNFSSWCPQTGGSSTRKPKSPMSSTSRLPTCVTRERDKKRHSVSIKLPEVEEKRPDPTSYYERSERMRMRRTNLRQSSCSKTERMADSHENVSVLRRADNQQNSTGLTTISRTSSAIPSSSGMKTRSCSQRTSSGTNVEHENSEVLRRVDALTALTRATMERVERLACGSTINDRSRQIVTENRRTTSSSTSGQNLSLARASYNDSPESTNSRLDVASISRTNYENDDDDDDDDDEDDDDNEDDQNDHDQNDRDQNDHDHDDDDNDHNHHHRNDSANIEDSSCTSVRSRRKIRQQPAPISILKNKKTENHDVSSSSSGTSGYRKIVKATGNVAASSTIENLTKKHGILKKRSSLDENEILRRRRSCSPVNAFPVINDGDFKPILKYERRSSLDELINRSSDSLENQRNPNNNNNNNNNHNHRYNQPQRPTSILKRKSSADEEQRDDGQSSNSEPTSILKRSSIVNCPKSSVAMNHVSIAAAVAKTLGFMPDSLSSGSEVRPILKKKLSREESASSDQSSLEPRPILKKKSSTDSDEHDERPKTILKYSRKSSADDSGNEPEASSPRKLSMLKNRSIQRRTNSLPECDSVRPILKQSSSRESSSPSRSSISGCSLNLDAPGEITKNLFLRKRARSLGHMQTSTLNESTDLPRSDDNSRRENDDTPRIKNDRSPSRIVNASCSNEFIDITAATINATIATIATATNTTTATSSIAPIVSFKLPSRQEMEDRYEPDDEDCSSLGDDGTNCPIFHHNIKKISNDDNDNDIDDIDDDDDRIRLTSRQISNRRRDKWNPRVISSDSRLSITKKSHYASSSSSSSSSLDIEDVKKNRKSKETPRIPKDEKSMISDRSEIRTNVSRIAQRFRNLEERMKSNGSREISMVNNHKYFGDTKLQQRCERFSTQPVTYDEVREAILQNQQRNAANPEPVTDLAETNEKTRDTIEPSKLSLAERVRLFDRRTTTDNKIVKIDVNTNDHTQRRRPANRYKTQPITSEEVEVASRIFPSDDEENTSETVVDSGKNENTTTKTTTTTTTTTNNRSRLIGAVPTPRGILKSTISQNSSEKRSYRLRDTRKKNESAGIIDEAYLLSSELKLTRKEFTKRRRSPRREREANGELDREFNENFVKYEENTMGLLSYDENPRVPRFLNDDNASRDKACTIEISDSVDNVETTGSSLVMIQRARRSVVSVEKTWGICANEDVSTDDKMKKGGTEETREIDFPGLSIAERLAALQRSGTTDWKRRVNNGDNVVVATSSVRSTVNDTLGDSMSQAKKNELTTRQRKKLTERLEELETAAEGWRKRVPVTDAVQFSVAGKMRVEQNDNAEQLSPIIKVASTSANDGKKKIPRPESFRSSKSAKNATTVARRVEGEASNRESTSESVSDESEDEEKSSHQTAAILSVLRTDDETFTSFFSNVSYDKCEAETLDFPESDFDFVTTFSERLGTRRTTKTQRRRLPSKNPLRTLAARTDLKNEYTEITTGVAERVMKTLNIEKFAKNSSLAVEALAGLASTEDFGAVTLKNVDTDSTGYGNRLPPHKDVMLILVKGRRHVQVRLVEPSVASINSGDNFILVTKNQLYNYVGKYSNVIERTRGVEIALSIQQNRDLGCRASDVITISEEKSSCRSDQINDFWKILNADTPCSVEVSDAGHPDEDELYESAMLDTNMVYEVVSEDELMPLEKYWAAVPKIEMLDPNKILVFDFGSEMYIWNGKIAPPEKRKMATHLAEELWQRGYDYTECTISPINSASMIGRRPRLGNNVKKGSTRPKWCLIGRLTQHMETVLFREKFLDWPNVSGIIRVMDTGDKEQADGKIIVEPPDVDGMIDSKSPAVDLVLEGMHLGRGIGSYDDELMRQFVVSTTNVTVWHIDEFSYSLVSGSSIGQFYTGDSYIVRWMYTVTITGRGLKGEPSKHAAKGRDRCAYFIWQGDKASLNEQGTAALLTVELDQEEGPQIRVSEGLEPAAFLNLFSGRMTINSGKKSKNQAKKKWRMYVCRGSEENEVSLNEVPCSTRQFRSRGSLILLDTKSGIIYVWHGRAALPHIRKNALRAADMLKQNRPEETGLSAHEDAKICEINEADELPDAFFEALGGMNKQLYVPLQGNMKLMHTPRLFHLSSVSGEFAVTELLCPHRGDLVTPFPFLQDELYQVNQPALFLLDNKNELWLWQGWWPDCGSEDQTGSGAVRWQAERRAGMITAMRYWEKLHPDSDDFPVYLVRAGLEPLEFTNLFPTWNYRDEIAELNIRDGRDTGGVLMVEDELARLTQSTYPIAQLLQRPLPDGVDPTILERYLSPQHFEELLGMNIKEFEKLPAWKQINVKKKIGLF